MSLCQHFGSPNNPTWVVISDPYPQDQESGYLFGGGYGYNHRKIWKMAGLPEAHIRSLMPCIGATYDKIVQKSNLLVEIDKYKPSLIIPLDDDILNFLVPSTSQIKEKNSSLRKWAGSLLTSPIIHYPHYIIGAFDPEFITRNWDQHEIQAFIYFGHVKEELDFYLKNGYIQPLPYRNLITEPPYDTLFDYLSYLLDSYNNGTIKYVSADIETIRPKQKSYHHAIHNPGYSYTLALAPSGKEAISFSLWDYMSYGASKHVKLWRKLNQVLETVPQIYQNGFIFDSNHLESLGCSVCLDKCQDTMLRHHILWPELPHKLQFQTIQYTREPFYKDEGKHWSHRFKKQLMVYNAKDAAVTYDIFNKQEEEFSTRPQLR